jgi:hypothetical protein
MYAQTLNRFRDQAIPTSQFVFASDLNLSCGNSRKKVVEAAGIETCAVSTESL